MERLGGLDAAFLYFETPTMHMHVSGLITLDPSTMEGGYSFGAIRRLLLERLPRMPAMRRKLVKMPFNLGRPYWVEDADFDLSYHLRRIGVPAPGGDQELAEIAADIASRPLDRSRPLWEMWVIEGLANGHIALFAKMHHSTIDGISGANLMVHLFDLEPRPVPPDVTEDAWQPEREPSELEMLGRGTLDTLGRPIGIAKLIPSTALKVGSIVWNVVQNRGEPRNTAAPFSAPRTSFNAAITAHRIIAFSGVALADVKKVKETFDVKVNDVIMAVVSGALRRYLENRGELPEKSLIASIPVSVHDDTGDIDGATKLSVMFSKLASDIADPVERLRAIAEANAEAKEIQKMVGADTLMQWAEHAAPNTFSLAARLYSSTRFADRHPVVHNLILSNVPGPPIPLYMAGARLVGLYPLGPIMDGAGLNVTVLSNEDRIDFGFIACRELVPRLWDLADLVPETLAELVKEADQASSGQASSGESPET